MKLISIKNTGEAVVIELQLLHAYEGLHVIVQTKSGDITPKMLENGEKIIITIPSLINRRPYKGTLKVLDALNHLTFYMNLNIHPVTTDRVVETELAEGQKKGSDQRDDELRKEILITEALFFDRKDIAERAKTLLFR